MARSTRWRRRTDGWLCPPTVPAKAGDRYKFACRTASPSPTRPPARKARTDVHDASLLVDPRSYEWQHADWRGRPWHEAVIYELHAGAFGGFDGMRAQLPRLAALGVTAVELMPIADFPGAHNWGYDGVLPLRAGRRLRHARPVQGHGRRRARAGADGVAGRGVQPFRARTAPTSTPFAKTFLPRGPARPPGGPRSTSASRRCGSTSRRTRCTGCRNTAWTACASTPCTPSRTRSSWTTWPPPSAPESSHGPPRSTWCWSTRATRPATCAPARTRPASTRSGRTTCITRCTCC